MNMTLLGNQVSADKTKDAQMRSYWISVPVRERKGRFDTERRGGEGHVETGVKLPEAKDCLDPPEARMEAGNCFALRPPGRSQPCPPLDWRLLASRTGSKSIYVVWSHQICGNMLWHPSETHPQLGWSPGTWSVSSRSPPDNHCRGLQLNNWSPSWLLRRMPITVLCRLSKPSEKTIESVHFPKSL